MEKYKLTLTRTDNPTDEGRFMVNGRGYLISEEGSIIRDARKYLFRALSNHIETRKFPFKATLEIITSK